MSSFRARRITHPRKMGRRRIKMGGKMKIIIRKKRIKDTNPLSKRQPDKS
jgi:hypothetical protein